MPTKPCVCIGLTNRIGRPVTGCRVTAGHGTSVILLVGRALVVAVQPLAGRARRCGRAAPVRPDSSCFLASGKRVVGGAHVGEHRAAFLRRHLLRVQHGQQRQRVLVGRVGVPVGGALDAVPVDLARLLDIGQPGDFRIIGMAILDQRVRARRAEAAAEGGELGARPGPGRGTPAPDARQRPPGSRRRCRRRAASTDRSRGPRFPALRRGGGVAVPVSWPILLGCRRL